MTRDEQAWDSPNTGTRMTVVRFGAAGEPLLYLPSSGGDQREFERYGMLADCKGRIESGELCVFSAEGRGPQTLFALDLPPDRRMGEYARFERYLRDELLPFIGERTGGRKLRLRGKGIADPKGGPTGDLIVTVQIRVPRGLDAEARAKLEELAKMDPPDLRKGLER